MLLRVVGNDDDRLGVENFVEQLIGRGDLLQRLFERDVLETYRVGFVLILLIVGNVDAGLRADEVEDIPDASVRAEADDANGRRRTEKRCALAASFLAQSGDRRLRSRCFNAIANRLLELHRLRGGQPVRRIEFEGTLVFEHRRVELIVLFEIVRPAEMFASCGLSGPLERDLVLRLLGALLDGLRVVGHGTVPVPDAGRLLALTIGVPRGTPRCNQGENDQSCKPVLQQRHSISTPVQSGHATCRRIPVRTCGSSSGRGHRRTPSPPIRRRCSRDGTAPRLSLLRVPASSSGNR